MGFLLHSDTLWDPITDGKLLEPLSFCQIKEDVAPWSYLMSTADINVRWQLGRTQCSGTTRPGLL